METPVTSATWPASSPGHAISAFGSILAAQGYVAPQNLTTAEPWLMPELSRCEPWIRDALKGAGLTLDEVREGVKAGWFHLFHTPDGAMVTEWILSPRMRALHVIAAGGSLRAIEELTPKIEDFARMAGASHGGASGRKGWVRWLRRFGYAPPALATVEKAF